MQTFSPRDHDPGGVSLAGADRGARSVTIDAPEVARKLAPLVKDRDLSRFIL